MTDALGVTAATFGVLTILVARHFRSREPM